jgi:hypothetical protein
MEADRKCPLLPHTFDALEAFVTRLQMLWAHLFGERHPALTLYINPLVRHLNTDPVGYKDFHNWTQSKAGTVIYYLKTIEQTYLGFKLMESQLAQPSLIPWPRYESLVQSVPELLRANPFQHSRDIPLLLQEREAAPRPSYGEPTPPTKRPRLPQPEPNPSSPPPQQQPPFPVHTNTAHNPQLVEFLQAHGPNFHISKTLTAIHKKPSDLLAVLGLTPRDCAKYYVLGKCSTQNCFRTHEPTPLEDVQVANAVQLLQQGCAALAPPADTPES